MSDAPVNRSVGGPPPRRVTPPAAGATSTLLRSNRTTAPTVPAAEQLTAYPGLLTDDPAGPPAEVPPPPPTSRRGEPSPRRRSATDLLPGEAPDDLVKFTFDLRREDRDAFRAAFGAARAFEGVSSLRELGMQLIVNETRRLEEAYNNGKRFDGGRKGLPRGDQDGLTNS
ncbi:hypothetical protein EDF46_3404 [Frondihabitans sp. PhB188]|uniref:hypothetical protein n=1 Tax=Frondihabitans sp. PhB188 TaxID=2485200 RepID=UPI000FA57BF5|nr:hypothetical protein [Frondihabitans sp. PhB188]ROQ30894.1 hypothetical protein EDF46_3404 [Frondihabitans sp. PhB188]